MHFILIWLILPGGVMAIAAFVLSTWLNKRFYANYYNLGTRVVVSLLWPVWLYVFIRGEVARYKAKRSGL